MTEPFARWPDEIGFAALNWPSSSVHSCAADAAAVRIFRRAQLVIWRKLWPELADQYDDQDVEEE